MREILTYLACAIVALLTAALVGPWLIDWPAHRELIDEQASRALGARVVTRGAIELKLLPTPILALDGFDVAADGLEIHAGKTRFELAVAPLLRGQLRFYEASIDQPDATLRASAATKAGRPADAAFERIHLTNARLRVLDDSGAARLKIDNLDLDGSAASLTGPFNAEGSFNLGEAGPARFHVATGALEANRMRLKLIFNETAATPRGEFDGALAFEEGLWPTYDGQAVLSGDSPAPWRVAGPLTINTSGARMDQFEARLGSDDAPVNLKGDASAEFGASTRARVALVARQLDLDRLFASPAFDAAKNWVASAGGGARAPFPVEVSLASPAALLGGETLADVEASAAMTPAGPVGLRLSAASGPGGSRLAMNGEVETGAASQFQGRLEFGARDLRRFVDWLGLVAPEGARRLRGLPVGSLDIAGDVSLSAVGFSAKDLTVKADRTTLSGSAAYTRALGGGRARLYADVFSNAFDLDNAPDLSGPTRALSDADLALTINARAIRVARFGEGAIDAGRIRLRLTREGDVANLEEFSIEDLGGATVKATGRADARGGALDGAIAADRLADMGSFLRRIAPGPASEALAARATALSPVKLAFHINATRAAPNAPLTVSGLTLDGAARGSKIAAHAKPSGDAGAIAGALSIESTDAAMLIRQLGFASPGLPGAGAARLDIAADGDLARGLAIEAAAKIAGSTLSFKGAVDGVARARGEASIASADAAPLLRLLGVGPPDATAIVPAQLNAHATLADGRLAFDGIAGSAWGARLAGDLALSAADGPAAPPKWTGALSLERLSLPALAQIALGPARLTKPGEIWSSTPFAAGMARAPLAELDLTIAELRLSDAVSVADARMSLSLSPGVVAVENVRGRLPDGTISGRATLRRDGPMASLLASLALDQAAFAMPAASGVASGSLDLSGTGDSMAALIGGLAGQGKARVERLTIPRADPAAPARVLAQADSGELFVSENDFIGALRRELDLRALAAGDRDVDATLAAGALTLNATGDVSLAWDLRAATLTSRVTLPAAHLPRDWSGPAPSVAVIWKGPFASPTRDIEAGSFVAALTARAVAREQARIEAFEADVRERAYFNRVLKGFAFMRQRDREIAAWEADQARQAADAERRRQLEAQRLERERIDRERRAEEARKRQDGATAADEPLKIAPPAVPSADVSAPAGYQMPPPGADPSTAGRY